MTNNITPPAYVNENHAFNVQIATDFGLECAILIHHFQFWIRTNARNKVNYHDGRYWTYQTQEALGRHFPYWSRYQIQRLLKKLEDKKILVKENFNDNPFNRTQWYAFVDQETFTEIPLDENSESRDTRYSQEVTMAETRRNPDCAESHNVHCAKSHNHYIEEDNNKDNPPISPTMGDNKINKKGKRKEGTNPRSLGTNKREKEKRLYEPDWSQANQFGQIRKSTFKFMKERLEREIEIVGRRPYVYLRHLMTFIAEGAFGKETWEKTKKLYPYGGSFTTDDLKYTEIKNAYEELMEIVK